MRPISSPARPLLRAGLALLAPTAALAAPQTTPDAFDAETTPEFRGSTPALYAGWDAFTLPSGGANLPDDPATDLAAGLEQFTPGAFITSTMNIYSPGAAPTFAIEVDAPGALREVALQVRTLGSSLDDSAFALEYGGPGGSTVSLAPGEVTVLLVGGGFAPEEKLVRFDLTGIADAPANATILFEAAAANCSLDAVMLDVRHRADVGVPYCAAVPNSTGQPGALVALGSDRLRDDDLTLRATDLPPNQFGIFVVGDAQASIPMAGGAGTLCLGGAIGRYQAEVFDSGSGGSAELAVDPARIPAPNAFVAAAAGETWNFQCWHRDAGTSNFTIAVAVTFE